MTRSYCLDDVEILPDQNLLIRRGESIRLEPKAMAVLLCLAESAGEVVSKEALIENVWEGRAVVPQVVAKIMHQLRRALEDNPRQPRFIQTVSRKGYRLTQPLMPVCRQPAPGSVKLNAQPEKCVSKSTVHGSLLALSLTV